jgi:hypothetical protein
MLGTLAVNDLNPDPNLQFRLSQEFQAGLRDALDCMEALMLRF